MPEGIQQRRGKGWRKPPDAISVTRGPGRKYGNPFVVGKFCQYTYRTGVTETFMVLDAEHAVRLFEAWLTTDVEQPNEEYRQRLLAHLPNLRGRDLMCFCPAGSPCHRDTLLRIVNA